MMLVQTLYWMNTDVIKAREEAGHGTWICWHDAHDVEQRLTKDSICSQQHVQSPITPSLASAYDLQIHPQGE